MKVVIRQGYRETIMDNKKDHSQLLESDPMAAIPYGVQPI
jgi:hypothetical protein